MSKLGYIIFFGGGFFSMKRVLFKFVLWRLYICCGGRGVQFLFWRGCF